MAEYGVQATELQAPQGAGAQTVAPVQPARPETGIIDLLSTTASIFAKGLEADRKAQADARKTSVVGQYIRSENAINDAITSGNITPSEGAARSRANFAKYAGGYAEYVGDIENAAKALRGYTEKGEIEDKIKSERDLQKKQLDLAITRGFTVYEGMSDEAKKRVVEASQAGVEAERALDQQYKANAEARASGTYNQGIADRQAKDQSLSLITNIADKNMDSFNATITDLSGKVKTGAVSPDQAQLIIGRQFSQISGAIQAAAATNPELAAPYRSLFNEMNEIGKKLVDPKQQAEDLGAQAQSIVNRAKVMILQAEPKMAAIAATSQLLGSNADLALAASKPANDAITKMLSTPIDSQGNINIPIVVGTENEKNTLDFWKGGINKLQQNKYQDVNKAKQELRNGINNTLIQAGQQMALGKDAKTLSGVAAFVASPEYAYAVTNGLVSREAAETAKNAFAQKYEGELVRGIAQSMDQYLNTQAAFTRNAGAPDLTTLGQTLNVKFTGSGIVFEPKGAQTLDPVQRADQQRALMDLRKPQQAINQLIQMGAHLAGTTDYAKYWEENKYTYLPQIYPIRPGDIVNGYKFKGGEPNDARNYEPVSR